MANPYYTFGPSFVPGTKVRSDQVNTQYSAIETGFDLLPSDSASIALATTTFAGTTGGTGNAYTASAPDTRLSNADGEELIFIADRANTGPATLNVDGIGAQSIVRPDGVVLASGDLQPGIIYGVRYDLTNSRWQLMVPATSYLNDVQASAAAAAASAAAALVSEGNAATSETNAATSASNALASENVASEWATNAVDDDISTSPGQFSALHWSAGAQEWATRAEDSLIPTNFGGNGVDDYSAYHWAQKASAASGLPIGGSANDSLRYDGAAWVTSSQLQIGTGQEMTWTLVGANTDANIVVDADAIRGRGILLRELGVDRYRMWYESILDDAHHTLYETGAKFIIEENAGSVAATFQPNAGAIFNYAGNSVLETRSGGIWVRGGAGDNPIVEFYQDTTVRNAAISANGSGGFLLNNYVDGGFTSFTGDDAGGVPRQLLFMDPDDSVRLYFEGLKAIETSLSGADIYDTSGDTVQIGFYGSTNTLHGVIQYSNSDAVFRSYGHGAQTYIRGENAGGSLRTMVQLDPSDKVQLNHPGTNTGSLSTESYGVQILGTGALRVSDGTTAQEPTAENGMLRYDTDTGKLRAVEGGVWTDVIGGGGASAFDDLSDVTITSAATGEMLRYDGANWVNTDALSIPLFASVLTQVLIKGSTGTSFHRIDAGTNYQHNHLVAGGTYTVGVTQTVGGFGTVLFADPDDRVDLKTADSSVFVALYQDSGTRIYTSPNSSVDLTDGDQPLMVGSSSTLQHLAIDDDTIQSKSNATTAAVLKLNPFGSEVELADSFRTDSDGATVFGDDLRLDNTGAGATRIRVFNSEGGFALLADGDTMQIRQTDNAGVDEDTWIAFANNGAVTLYNNNIATARTATLASGGFEVDKDYASGFDPVVTTGDLQGTVKSANTTRVSTVTLTDDSEMAGFGLEPSSEYIIEVVARFSGGGATNNGFRWGFDYNGQVANLTVTSGSAFSYQTGGTAESLVTPTTGVSQVKNTFDTAGVDEVVEIKMGVITGASYTAGTAIDFQFAQAVSQTTATTLEAGSWMRVTKIA